MKNKTLFLIAFMLLVNIGFFFCHSDDRKFSVDPEIGYYPSQAIRILVSLPSIDKIPNSMNLDNVKWHLYEDIKDNIWKDTATKVIDIIAPLAYKKARSHGSDFIMMTSLGNAYYQTGNTRYKEGLLHVADSFTMLYNPVVGTILPWSGMVKKTGLTMPLIRLKRLQEEKSVLANL